MKNWKDGRKLITVICENCKKSFNKTSSEYKRSEKNNKKHFCSKECGYQDKENKKINFCKFCGNEITGRDKRKIFCSHNCSASYNNGKRKISEETKKIMSEARIKNLNNSEIKIKYDNNPNYCKTCNNELPFNIRNSFFCSKECRITYNRKDLTPYQIYYRNCQFKFGLSDYPNEFDFTLIEKYGWYQAKNHGNNLGGISRDHMISIKYGFENNIDFKIISHPANCKLMIHNENVSKHKNCSITLDDLLIKIEDWNKKYN